MAALTLRVPNLGESVQEATLGAWKHAEGDQVGADEPLVEVESEKATLEVPSPGAGILRKILRKTGETVSVGDPIAEIEPIAAAAGAVKPAAASAKGDGGGRGAPGKPSPTSGDGNGRSAAAAASAPGADLGGSAVRAAPSARRAIAEAGLSVADVKGTGRGGRISKQDVDRALEARSHESAPPPAAALSEPLAEPELTARPAGLDSAHERIVPMSPLRKTVARRLVEAQNTAAILTTFNEIDMTSVMALRERYQERFQKQHGIKLGFMSFFVKATIEALKAFPALNAEIRGTDIIYKDHYDIGVAVGGGKGLVVPVVRDADRLSFAELESAIGELAVRARDNKLVMRDLEGGTFSISNGGVYGSLMSTPILNPPQSGILGLHAIQKRPVVTSGDAIAVRPMMYVALSYDHRIVDGREAVQFLVRVKECVEDPERILLEI